MKKKFNLITAIFVVSVQQVFGYASWLKCFVELDDTEVIMNHKVLPADKAKAPVKIEIKVDGDDEWTNAETYTLSKKHLEAGESLTINARLNVPSTFEDEDVQYVMEAKNGGTFVGTGVMCEGTRGFARQYDEEVKLTVPIVGNDIELVAGWAIGHDAVSLTPTMTLKSSVISQQDL